MVKMNTSELFPDIPDSAPVSASGASRIIHEIVAYGPNGTGARAAISQSWNGRGWTLSGSGQPTVTASSGFIQFIINMRIGIDILMAGMGGAVTNIGSLNRTVIDSFDFELDEYRRGERAPLLSTSRLPRFTRRRGALHVQLYRERAPRARLVNRGGPVQKWRVQIQYSLGITTDFTEAQVGPGNPRSYASGIDANAVFFVDQPRL